MGVDTYGIYITICLRPFGKPDSRIMCELVSYKDGTEQEGRGARERGKEHYLLEMSESCGEQMEVPEQG